mgnify:CR=1 FL=1
MHEPEKVLLTSLRLGYKYPRHYYLYWKFLLFLQNKRQISKILPICQQSEKIGFTYFFSSFDIFLSLDFS